jgi:DNA-binding response OmpR family regulator
MTRVLALVPDLMFGSRLAAAAGEAGIELELVGDEPTARARLAQSSDPGWDVLVVDLTDPDLDGAALVSSLRDAFALASTSTLGFYAHVDAATRERALDAGFDVVVPRSRMAREAAALLRRLSR